MLVLCAPKVALLTHAQPQMRDDDPAGTTTARNLAARRLCQLKLAIITTS